MNGTIQALALDMYGAPKRDSLLQAKQYDTNSRKARLMLKAGKEPYQLPFDCKIYIYVKKPDNTVVFNECEKEDESTVLAPLTKQTLSATGTATCELYILAADGDIKPQTFYLEIEKTNVSADAIESADEFGVLQSKLIEIQTAIVAAQDTVVEARKAITEVQESIAQAHSAADVAQRAAGSLQVAIDAAKEAKESRAAAQTAAGEAETTRADIRAYVRAEKAAFVGYNKRESDMRYANAIVGTASGTGSVTMPGAWDAPVRNLVVEGKSEQFTTTGAQLLDVSTYAASTVGASSLIINGTDIVITSSGDRADIYVGNVTGSSIADKKYEVEPNTVYTVSYSSIAFSNSENVFIRTFYVGFFADTTHISYKTYTANSLTFTTPEDCNKVVLRFGWRQNTATSGETITISKVMLRKGNTALAWEPYTGGMASPNPDYPQEIKNVDNPIVVSSVGNRNLFYDTKKLTNQSNKLAGWNSETSDTVVARNIESGFAVVTMSASGLASNSIKGINSNLIPIANVDKDIKFSFYIKVGNFDAWDVRKPMIYELYNADMARIGWHDVLYNHPYTNKPTVVNNEWVHFTYTRTIDDLSESSISYLSGKTKDDVVYIGIRLALFQNGQISFKQPKAELGNSPWTPAPEDITDDNRNELLPYINAVNLNGYTFYGIDDVRDRLECRDGVWGVEASYGQKILNGMESWARQSINDYGVANFSLSTVNTKNVGRGFATHFIRQVTLIANTKTTGFLLATNVIYIRLTQDALPTQTVDGFKAFLVEESAKGTPVKVIYELTEPTWTPLPDNLQQRLNELQTYRGGHTTIYATSDVLPDLEVEYVQDSNKVVENLKLDMAEQAVDFLAAIEQLKITNNLS